MLRFGMDDFREQYEKAKRLGKLAFVERPYIGSPGAPAQAETNASQIWGSINAGYLIGYEYTRWWKESWALRHSAVIGDWSWLNKTRVRGKDAGALLDYATVKDLSKQQPGQIRYTPMVDANGKVAIEGLTLKFDDDDYLFSQSAGLKWLEFLRDKTGLKVDLEDVTPGYTCFALQGPASTDVLEALTGSVWKDLPFSRFRSDKFAGVEMLVARQGVTGEVGYELMMDTKSGRAHELWRKVREVGRDFGLRELGFKAQLVGHTETGIATVIRDFIPARGAPEELRRMLRHWMSAEELDAAPWQVTDHLCSPAELGWSHTIDLGKKDFFGKEALAREAASGGPRYRLMGLEWSSEDMAELYAAQFRDAPAAPPPDLPYGQFRVLFLRILQEKKPVGWASGYAYSPTLRRMISLARLDRALAAGAEVTVQWGGFSDEPVCPIRARVVQLPFIKRERERVLA
jgi:glycine cleavage system aminomethyltransferase T